MENETAQPPSPVPVAEPALPVVPVPKKSKTVIIFIICLVLGLTAGGIYLYIKQKSLQAIQTYEDCTKAGYPATLSYPSTCRTPDGRNFVQVVSPAPTPSPSL